MIDENVHFAHTRKLIDALIKENKPYLLQVIFNLKSSSNDSVVNFTESEKHRCAIYS
jgi:hypothetical protein